MAGTEILSEVNRKLAQQDAEKLQARARGEIFDRIFHGYPVDALDVKLTKIDISETDPNILVLSLQQSFKDSFIKSFESTVRALSLFQCKDRKRTLPTTGRYASDDVTQIAEETLFFPTKCRGPHQLQLSEVSKLFGMVCLGLHDVVRCYGLPKVDYCSSCPFKTKDHEFSLNNVVVFGRFIDTAWQSALINSQKCMIGVASQPRNISTDTAYVHFDLDYKASYLCNCTEEDDRFFKATEKNKPRFIAALDFDPRTLLLKVNRSSIDLKRAKYLVTVAGMTSQSWSEEDIIKNKRWILNLVPDASPESSDGCALLDDAVQRQMSGGNP
ncbi:MAG: hypothetical protein HQL76_06375 [Magnetococcales bacterium]|nr:hypothetical protein [Magnetococcales bacterium]